jgi:hypothetical protein
MLTLVDPLPEQLRQLHGQRESIWHDINTLAWHGLRDIELHHNLWEQWHYLRLRISQLEQR